MGYRIAEEDLIHSYREALELCAADGGASAERPRVLRIRPHYKSAHAFVTTGSGDEPTHVVKIAPAGWDPKQEFEGLQHVARAFRSEPTAGRFRLGAIRPVGYGLEPGFLVTRYQRGTPVRPTFDRAITAPYGRAVLPEAKLLAGAVARWLVVFRSAGIRAGEGLRPEDYLEFCRARADEIRRYLGADRVAENVVACLESHLSELSERDLALMANAYPSHNDLSPQNLQVDEQDVLYVFDLESFKHSPMNIDLGSLRRRLEEYALRAPYARSRAQEVWGEFWDVYVAEGDSARFGLLCHLHKLLAILAWLKNPERSATGRARSSLRTRARVALWIRQRLRWLEGLTGDVAADIAYLRGSL